jgi:hypothetical protein
MLDVDALPEQLVDDLKKRGHTLEQIKQMSPKKAFDEYCNWNGLFKWGDHLWLTMHKLKDACDELPVKPID